MSAVISDFLDLMLPGEGSTASSFQPPPQAPAPRARKISYTHDAMIDMLIAHPEMSQDMLAARFGYSASWISQVISSDQFQARLAERKDALVDPMIRATVEEQFKGIAARSLEILRAKLDRPSADVPDNLALRAFELASRAAGYGARTETPPVKVDFNVHLNHLGENLVGLLRRKKTDALEAQFHDITQEAHPTASPQGSDAANAPVSSPST